MKPIKDFRNEYGLRHKLGQPSLVFPDGEEQWFVNGQLHRDDGPAITKPDGSKYWVIENKYHRTDGPAMHLASGHKEWWVNGKKHRIDGPAIECVNGHKQWFINGKECSSNDIEVIKMNKQLLHNTQVPSISNEEYEAWYSDGKLHRLDGPALTFKLGKKEWWVNGQRHREDGPAIEYTANIFGNLRNLHEDACRNHYYLNNVLYTEKDYYVKLLELQLKDCSDSLSKFDKSLAFFSKLKLIEKKSIKLKEFEKLINEGQEMAKQFHEETKGSRIFTQEELKRKWS